MTTKDLYREIEINKCMEKKELYLHLIQTFIKSKVDFTMFNMFQYIHKETEEKEKRIDQYSFRNDLIERYNSCIISGVSEIVCEACHIIPYSCCEDKDKYNVDNGILLRSDLHKLFDSGLLKINPNTLQVMLSKQILLDPKMIQYIEFNNKKININKNSISFLKKIF